MSRRRADHLNNAEQITLRRPAPGQYRVLTTTLNDEDTTLPVETAAEANAS